MRYFYDTEFFEDGKSINLISIGIVSEDGREYYAVNSNIDAVPIAQRVILHKWLMVNVVPNLPLKGHLVPGFEFKLDKTNTCVKPPFVIANEIRDFLSVNYDDSIELWAYYGAYDHIVLMQLYGSMIDKPAILPMWTHDIMQFAEPYNVSIGQAVQQTGTAHNALDDARWTKAAWEYLNDLSKRPSDTQ